MGEFPHISTVIGYHHYYTYSEFYSVTVVAALLTVRLPDPVLGSITTRVCWEKCLKQVALIRETRNQSELEKRGLRIKNPIEMELVSKTLLDNQTVSSTRTTAQPQTLDSPTLLVHHLSH